MISDYEIKNIPLEYYNSYIKERNNMYTYDKFDKEAFYDEKRRRYYESKNGNSYYKYDCDCNDSDINNDVIQVHSEPRERIVYVDRVEYKEAPKTPVEVQIDDLNGRITTAIKEVREIDEKFRAKQEAILVTDITPLRKRIQELEQLLVEVSRTPILVPETRNLTMTL